MRKFMVILLVSMILCLGGCGAKHCFKVGVVYDEKISGDFEYCISETSGIPKDIGDIIGLREEDILKIAEKFREEEKAGEVGTKSVSVKEKLTIENAIKIIFSSLKPNPKK